MALQDIKQTVRQGDGGGGMFGSVLGQALGAVGGLVASGGNPAGAMTGAGIGGQIGGIAGAQVDSGSSASQSGGVAHQQESSPLMTVKSDPNVMLAQMQTAKQHLQNSNMPGAEAYMAHIDNASNLLKQRMGG